MTSSSPDGAGGTLGAELKRLRQRARKTQDDVARELGVARPMVSQWENGRHVPQPDKVLQLDRFLEARGELHELAESLRDVTPERTAGTGRRISLHEVYDRLGRVLVDQLVEDDDTGEILGWRRDFREDVPVSAFSTVLATLLLCVLPNAPYVDGRSLRGVVERFREKGGWATRFVGVRPETTAFAIDVLARLGAADLDDHLEDLEELMDSKARTSTYVLAEVLGIVARLRPQSAFCGRLVRDLLDARRPTRQALWPEKSPPISAVVPPPSTAHTARAVTALLLAVEAGVDDNGEIAEAVEIGSSWLVREGQLTWVRENLEPIGPDGRTRDLEIRHATPALVARALALGPDPSWPAVQTALDHVWKQFNPELGRWTWPNGDVPIWLQYDAVTAVRAAAERTTFASLPDSALEEKPT